jgi:hypothetical protein
LIARNLVDPFLVIRCCVSAIVFARAGNSDINSPLPQIPFLSGPGKRKLVNQPKAFHDRLKRTKLARMLPQMTGKSSLYLHLQEDPSEKILDDRPHPDADIPPIPLLYDGFGHFLDVMDGHDDVPGLADVEVRELRDAVDDFATKMTHTSVMKMTGGM